MGSSLCRCSSLLGFIMSKNLRGLWFYLLIKVQNATRRKEHLQSEEPISSDPYFRYFTYQFIAWSLWHYARSRAKSPMISVVDITPTKFADWAEIKCHYRRSFAHFQPPFRGTAIGKTGNTTVLPELYSKETQLEWRFFLSKMYSGAPELIIMVSSLRVACQFQIALNLSNFSSFCIWVWDIFFVLQTFSGIRRQINTIAA